MICTLAVMYSCVHSSSTTVLVFSLVIKDFFTQQLWTKNTIAHKLETQFQAWALNGIQTSLWLSEPIQWEYAAVEEMVSSCLQMEVSVTGTVGTLAQQQCAAALSSAKDASTEGGTGERSVLLTSPFFYCLRFLFWKPLRSKFPHSERGDEKARSFETCPSTNVKKRGNDSYL